VNLLQGSDRITPNYISADGVTNRDRIQDEVDTAALVKNTYVPADYMETKIRPLYNIYAVWTNTQYSRNTTTNKATKYTLKKDGFYPYLRELFVGQLLLYFWV
jgi:hypothetical protein